MPVAITEPLAAPIPLDPPRQQWTREMCQAVADRGLLDLEALELIEGELIKKVSKKRPHSNSIWLLLHLLGPAINYRFLQQAVPIDVAPEDNPSSEPEPDLILLTKPPTEFWSGNPGPGDLRLVVEVSDSSLRFDRNVKSRLYARAGIVEYWIVDVNDCRILVHREPVNGEYRQVASYGLSETVSPLAEPDVRISVADLFKRPA